MEERVVEVVDEEKGICLEQELPSSNTIAAKI